MKRFAATLAVMLLLSASAASARAQDAPRLPDTKPGELMLQWLKLCDAGDAAQMKQWAEANLPELMLKRVGAESFARSMARDCAASGGYQVLRVMESQRDQLDVATLSRKTKVHLQVRLAVTAEGKARGVDIGPMAPPESAVPDDLRDQAIATWLKAHVNRLARADQFSGIAIIARGTHPLAEASAGYANREKRTPITPQTQFTIGSMGKMFTAVAVGQLVDQGKLSFDDVVGKIFPRFRNVTVREKVTVAMLLSHTSGMRDFLGKRTPEMMKNGVRRAAEFLPLYENDEPRFAPGTSWAYSNAGLALAGAIVEKVSGEDYPTYIRRHVFEPAGMKNSDPNNVPRMNPRMVTPYTDPGDPYARQRWREAERDIGSPAGGATSTAEDLLKFADALRGNRLVTRATLQKMTEGRPTPLGEQYGYGMAIDQVYGRKVVGHSGGFPGVSTELYIVLDSSYTAVVLANQDPPSAEMVGEAAKAVAAKRAKKADVGSNERGRGRFP